MIKTDTLDSWQGGSAVLHPSVPASPPPSEELYLSMAGWSMSDMRTLEGSWLTCTTFYVLQQPVQLAAGSRMLAEEQTCPASWTCKRSLCYLNLLLFEELKIAAEPCHRWDSSPAVTLLTVQSLLLPSECFSSAGLLHSSCRVVWLILTIAVLLAVLLGGDWVFFTPKDSLSGFVYLRQEIPVPCSVEQWIWSIFY